MCCRCLFHWRFTNKIKRKNSDRHLLTSGKIWEPSTLSPFQLIFFLCLSLKPQLNRLWPKKLSQNVVHLSYNGGRASALKQSCNVLGGSIPEWTWTLESGILKCFSTQSICKIFEQLKSPNDSTKPWFSFHHVKSFQNDISSDFWFKNVFRCKIRRNSPMHGDILFANAEIVYKLRSDPPLHFDKWQICTEKRNASGRGLLPATILKCWPHVCRVKVTFTSLPTYWFVSTATKSTMCLGYWIRLKIRVRSSNALHYLKVAEATI